MVTRPTWDEYGMSLAQAVRERAACLRRQVGAVIMDNDTHWIVATGYNGVPAGATNCSDGGCPRGLLSYNDCPAYGSYSNCVGSHAEPNAIDQAWLKTGFLLPSTPGFLTNHTICVTHDPCADCAEHIVRAGIERVISPNSGG